mmetsp:Transcript_29536/g.71018  ORF Transcript_29536/g.71018 Transcript_29536/m.71018 type:complete len:80 (-) Transcript_29536:218-457(-)
MVCTVDRSKKFNIRHFASLMINILAETFFPALSRNRNEAKEKNVINHIGTQILRPLQRCTIRLSLLAMRERERETTTLR